MSTRQTIVALLAEWDANDYRDLSGEYPQCYTRESVLALVDALRQAVEAIPADDGQMPESAKFMISLMSSMHSQTTATVDSLWRAAVVDLRMEEAHNAIVNERIYELCHGPYTPNPMAITKALYVPRWQCEERLESLYPDGDWKNPEKRMM